MTIEVREKDGSAVYRLLNDSVFNIYNVVAAVALFRQLGYPREKIQHFFSSMDIVGSRYDARQVGDSVIHLMLAKDKNAFAGSRAVSYTHLGRRIWRTVSRCCKPPGMGEAGKIYGRGTYGGKSCSLLRQPLQ